MLGTVTAEVATGMPGIVFLHNHGQGGSPPAGGASYHPAASKAADRVGLVAVEASALSTLVVLSVCSSLAAFIGLGQSWALAILFLVR